MTGVDSLIAVAFAAFLGWRAPAAVWREEIVVRSRRWIAEGSAPPVGGGRLEGGELVPVAAAALDDVLRRLPEFSLFRRTSSLVAHPTTQGVSLRGVGPSGAGRSLVLLDGVPLNDPFGGWIGWSRVPLSSLERVEVQPGGGSDVWGTGALAGVLQVVTRSPGERLALAAVRAGSRNETLVDAGVGGELPHRIGYAVDVEHFETGGYPVVRAGQRGAIDVPAWSRHDALYARLRLRRGTTSSLAARWNLYREARGNGTPLTDNSTHGYSLTVELLRAAGTGWWRLAGSAQRQGFRSRFSAQASDRSSERPALDQDDVPSRRWRVAFDRSRATATGLRRLVGLDLQWDEGSSGESFRFQDDGDGGRFTRRRRAGGRSITGGLFLQERRPIGSRWSLTAGVRGDLWALRKGLRREWDAIDGRLLERRRFRDRERFALSPRLTLAGVPTPGLRVQAAAYGAFRAPTLNELFRPFRVRNDVTEANSSLRPERLWGLDLGVGWQRGATSLRFAAFGARLRQAVSSLTLGFGGAVVEPCGFVPAGGACRQRQNTGGSRVVGLSMDLARELEAGWTVDLRALWTRSVFARDGRRPGLGGRRLPQVPTNRGSLRFAGPLAERLELAVEGRWSGRQFEDAENRLRLAGFGTVNVGLTARLASGWQAVVGVENLLDREIEAGRSTDGLVTVGGPRLLRAGLRLARR